MPNPESLILNILLWDIIKMTHQIAFVNYWIMLLQQVFRQAPFNYWNQLVPQALIKLFVHEYFRAKRNIAYILLLSAA